ncbi:MAG: hypothetical protein IT163_09885 [Bryobacterales bacterium]|nr:hypothetical protein [Bryobacterales bacterium]
MAYKRQEYEIRFGGVSLLGPGDKIAGDDALQIQNFRVDRYGHLRGRKGSSTASGQCAFASGSAAEIHTARFLLGRRYWGYTIGGGGRLERNTTFIASGFADVQPLGLAAMRNWVWIMNQAAGKQLRDTGVGTTLYLWQPAAPTTTAIGIGAFGSGSIKGKYKYYVTYGTANAPGAEDFESNPSPATAEVDATAGVDYIGLTNLPVSADPQVNCRHIYRIGTGGGSTLSAATRVATIYNNALTTHDDYQTDVEVAAGSGETIAAGPPLVKQGAAVLMETDHDPAPLANGVVAYMNRLVVFRDSVNPRRIYYTPAFKPWYFRGSNNGTVGDWFDVDDDVVTVTVKPRMLYIYTKSSIWRIVGDISENPPELQRSDYGIVGPRAVASMGHTDLFLSKEGLCEFNGDFAKLVSPKLDPVFHDDAFFIARGVAIQHNPMADSSANLATASLAVRSGRVWMSFVDTASVRQTWQYEVATQRWVRDSRRLFNFLDEGQGGDLILCFHQAKSGAGYVGAHYAEDAATDGSAVGSNYDAAFHSAYLDQGFPESEKVYEDITIDADTGGLNMTVKVYTNNGELAGDEYNIGTINTSTRQPVTFPLNTTTGPGIRGRNLAVRLECTNTGQTIQVFRIFGHYYVEPRKAKSFDTGETDLRSPWVKEFDQILLKIKSTANVDWKLYTELPSGTMAVAASGTITTTTTEKPIVLPITAGVHGRLMRLTLYCASGVFQLYDDVQILVRPTPEYFNGANGEKFVTLPQSLN